MFTSTPVASLSDSALLAELAACAEVRRAADARAAAVAGEIAARSEVAAGYAGLTQGTGARTTEVLVQRTTGLSKRDAAAVLHAPDGTTTALEPKSALYRTHRGTAPSGAATAA